MSQPANEDPIRAPQMPEPQILMYSTTWCGDCRRSKRWLQENNIAYREINIEVDPAAAEEVRRLNHGYEVVPTILFPDGAVLAEPSNRQLALQIEASLGILTLEAEKARG